ncbi:general secretion pathway protein GspE [Myxococcus sp. K15C18031901]|uniref:general secretion pathway protein GspE n=1 Tax=Myxococcus dinghuensis TaxID=2906761 RepID=UPI0020A74C4A|nr:general secretion pathway protein GspE [Myxococcus dinghuensis]MCP3101358.1 general secretion pathway protein GspE [Myxococcus dinghuensis]
MDDSSEALTMEAAGTFLASHGESVASLVGKAVTDEPQPVTVDAPVAQTESAQTPDTAVDAKASAESASAPRDEAAPNLDDSGASTERPPELAGATVPPVPAEAPASGGESSPHLTVVSAESPSPERSESAASSTDAPLSVTELSPVSAPAPVVPSRRAPIELDELPPADDAPMQLASTWEFVGWQGADTSGPIGHSPETTWADRTVDIDGPLVREAPAAPTTGDMPLASAWDFIQQPWQPQAVETSEVLTSLLAAATAATSAEMGNPAVTVEHVLSALENVATQGTLGKVLIAYCAGRFQRAFLLGESFGLVRVGHAWGPGSDSPAVSALKVDLEGPSLLMSSLGSPGPSRFDAPACAQDEAIFSSLGGPSSRLVVVPIRARGRPVAFVVADPGVEPMGETAFDELTRVAVKAAETYDRLPASRAD